MLPTRLRLRHHRMGQSEEVALRHRRIYRLPHRYYDCDLVYVAGLVGRANCASRRKCTVRHGHLMGAGAWCHNRALCASSLARASDDRILITLAVTETGELWWICFPTHYHLLLVLNTGARPSLYTLTCLLTIGSLPLPLSLPFPFPLLLHPHYASLSPFFVPTSCLHKRPP
jgi:hypothetical protein